MSLKRIKEEVVAGRWMQAVVSSKQFQLALHMLRRWRWVVRWLKALQLALVSSMLRMRICGGDELTVALSQRGRAALPQRAPSHFSRREGLFRFTYTTSLGDGRLGGQGRRGLVRGLGILGNQELSEKVVELGSVLVVGEKMILWKGYLWRFQMII